MCRRVLCLPVGRMQVRTPCLPRSGLCDLVAVKVCAAQLPASLPIAAYTSSYGHTVYLYNCDSFLQPTDYGTETVQTRWQCTLLLSCERGTQPIDHVVYTL